MSTHPADDAMNRLINALRYSLANYLCFARPWSGAANTADVIWSVATRHREHVARLGELLIARHGHVESRSFPIAFTSLNDLAFEFVRPLVVEDERQLVRIAEATADALKYDFEAYALVREILDSERRNLQRLQEASDRRRGAPADTTVSAGRRTTQLRVASKHVRGWPVRRGVPELVARRLRRSVR